MQVVGRYALFDEIAHGGMATVHLGRLLGQGGFSRTVAIKRLHPHLARDPEFVTMLLDEARLVGRIQHPNVVQMLDVVATDGELMIVMEHVQGVSLSRLLQLVAKRKELVPPAIASAILVNVLRGLHASHEVQGESGELLGLVHRDVTPHNVMVRTDGTAVMLDFGVAKAAGRFHTTEEGKIKGKLPFMAPEQLRGQPVTRRTDLYAAGAVLWQTLTSVRLFRGENEGELLERVLFSAVEPPSARVAELPSSLDAVVMRALSRDPSDRFATAAEMANALEEALPPALPSVVAGWIDEHAGPALVRQAALVRELESGTHLSLEGLPDEVVRMLEVGATPPRGAVSRATADAAVAEMTPPRSSAAPSQSTTDPSQSTTSSVVSAVPPPTRRRSRTLWVALGACVVAGVLGWYAARSARTSPIGADSPAASAPVEPAPLEAPSSPTGQLSAISSAASMPSSPPSAESAGSATPQGGAEPSATSSPARSGATTGPPAAPAAGPPPGAATQRPPRPPATSNPNPAECVRIDANGHRTYDRRCLQ